MKTRTKVLLSLLAASVLATGCEMMEHREHERGYRDHERGYVQPLAGVRIDCGNPTCFVTVDVSNCSVGDPGELHIYHKGPTEIIWRLTAGDHDFTPNGITFRGGPFSGGHSMGRGVFTVHDDNRGGGMRYKYAITVKKDGAPGNCPVKDPDVINENPW